ncbi:hypothetical protein BH11BAC1_BH11BAC1_09940 [soil metagenome]
MKKSILNPAYIVLASLIYFLIASAALAQEPGTETKQEIHLAKYCTNSENGKMSIVDVDGKQVTEPITLKNGATVSLDGAITWKDGSKSNLNPGDCIGVDKLGGVYIFIAPTSKINNSNGIISNR